MKKQMYIQPEIEISRLATMNIVCVSAGEGTGGTGVLNNGGSEETEGDAPLRKLF